jgi:hypothetical protein
MLPCFSHPPSLNFESISDKVTQKRKRVRESAKVLGLAKLSESDEKSESEKR